MQVNLDENRKRTIELWNKVDRLGTEEIIRFLETSDYFAAPCSTEHHLCVTGGLAQHSLNVYDLLMEKIEHYLPIGSFEPDTKIICGLGHDLCKVNFYARDFKWYKDEQKRWQQKLVWVVKDQFPMGHGEKSVSILQDYIKLTEAEKLAIRWHMCAFDAGIHFNYPSGFPFREASKNPLVVLLFTADYEASQILEK